MLLTAWSPPYSVSHQAHAANILPLYLLDPCTAERSLVPTPPCQLPPPRLSGVLPREEVLLDGIFTAPRSGRSNLVLTLALQRRSQLAECVSAVTPRIVVPLRSAEPCVYRPLYWPPGLRFCQLAPRNRDSHPFASAVRPFQGGACSPRPAHVLQRRKREHVGAPGLTAVDFAHQFRLDQALLQDSGSGLLLNGVGVIVASCVAARSLL